MLNPSKATESDGDNTVDRQVERARRNGAGAIIIVNAGAVRETQRKIALRHPDPVGVDNAFWIERFTSRASLIVLAHGPDAATKFGGDRLLRRALGAHAGHALRVTKNGSPGHPLYLAYASPLLTLRLPSGLSQ